MLVTIGDKESIHNFEFNLNMTNLQVNFLQMIIVLKRI